MPTSARSGPQYSLRRSQADVGLKMDDGSFVMHFPTHPEAPVPHLEVNKDTGNYVYAIAQLPPGKSYMAEGSTCSWSEYMRVWSKITGASGTYQQITVDQLTQASPDREFGAELADMFAYSSEPGYDGGDASLLKAADIRKVQSQ
jgi:hypothetical protein